MSTPYFWIKRVASSKRSFLVTSGVAALIAFATVGVAAFSLIAYSPPTPVVLFATGLGGLSLLGWQQETEGLLMNAGSTWAPAERRTLKLKHTPRNSPLHKRDQIVAIPTPNNSSSGNCRGVGGGGIHFFGQTSEGAWPRSLHCLDDHKKKHKLGRLNAKRLFYSGKSRHASVGSCRDPRIRGPDLVTWNQE